MMEILSFLYQKLLFSPRDVMEETGTLRSAITLLNRYQKQGYVSKVRRGLYCVNNLATKQPEANKYQVASAITTTSYVAYHAAMEYHGLAHQVYYDVTVVTAQAFNSFEFDGNRYIAHQSSLTLGVDNPFADSHMRVTSVERTVIDCIDRIDLCGGWEELVNCLQSIQYLREEQLVSVLDAYAKPTLYKKVGFLCQVLQMPVSEEFVKLCWQYAKASVTHLTSEGESNKFCQTWRIYVPHNLLTINQQNQDELV